jgi:hypothetical protein
LSLFKGFTEFSAPKTLGAIPMEKDVCYSVKGQGLTYLWFFSDEGKLVERTEERSLCTFNLKGLKNKPK